MPHDRIVVSPHWEWWVVFYFFLGGIAAGAYFMAALIDLLGTEEDHDLARVGYYIAFPLVALCGVLLILDLTRPERFWHMLLQSETGWPMIKYWSPMSLGAWVLLIFGGFALLSFLGALAEDRRLGLGRFRSAAGRLRHGLLGLIYLTLGALTAFFIAGYTGALLTASNQPIWSDSTLIGALFLASAGSTGIATMILLRRRATSAAALERLEFTDSWAIGMELLMLLAFLVSLGSLALPLLASSYGILLLIGTVLLGLLAPLALRLVPGLRGSSPVALTAILVLIGGFVLRYSVVMAGQHLVIAGR